MNKKLGTILIVVIVAVALVVIGWIAHRPTASAPLTQGVAGQGVPSNFDNMSLTGVLQVGVNPNGNITAIPTQFATGTVYAQGDLIQGGDCQVSSVVSTTTLNLTAANLQCTQLDITNSSSSALTVNLPSSSTVSYLGNIGDETDTFIYAASTTAGNLTIVAGTGFSIASPIGIASTTAASSTITGGNVMGFFINKLPTTNLLGIMIPSK